LRRGYKAQRKREYGAEERIFFSINLSVSVSFSVIFYSIVYIFTIIFLSQFYYFSLHYLISFSSYYSISFPVLPAILFFLSFILFVRYSSFSALFFCIAFVLVVEEGLVNDSGNGLFSHGDANEDGHMVKEALGVLLQNEIKYA
jgi:hypothetical protein